VVSTIFFFTIQCALCRFSIRAGLVFPRFAASKAEMVAAGVIPIDRLTDVRAPIEVAAARCGKQQLEAVYGIHMPTWPEDGTAAAASATPSSAKPAAAAAEVDSSASSQPAEETAAAEAAEPAPAAASYASSSSRVQQQQLSAGALLLLGLARARGWATASGLADEARAGRQILKDYTNGKLLYCKLPPGFGRVGFAPDVAPLPGTVNAMQLGIQQQQQPKQQQQQQRQAGSSSSSSMAAAGAAAAAADDVDDDASSGSDADADDEAFAAAAAGAAEPNDPSMLLLSEADLELMEGLGVSRKAKSSKRADHKFHKKAARSKGSRGIAVDAGGYDGAALSTGKKGGLVRVGGY
jgi:large subunit GTPase 1